MIATSESAHLRGDNVNSEFRAVSQRRTAALDEGTPRKWIGMAIFIQNP